MSRSPRSSDAGVSPKVSSTFEKSEKVTEVELPVPPASGPMLPLVPNAPGSARTVRPPPPPPSSRPRLPGTDSRPRLPGTDSRPRLPSTTDTNASKTTMALGDGDLEPLSALAVTSDFSIRRGVVLGGRFRVNQLIGAGAQCYVYSAEHTTLKSPVAIKCLQPQLVTPDLVDRFAREAQALTAIRNAHVAAVLDVGRAPCGTPFIVMEFLQGRDLSALLETRPRLEPRQATEILLQTCEGLAAAHALGLVHQDIKPSNIFLSDEMGIVKAKVVDFGVARVSINKTTSLRPRFKRSELDNTVGGTPFYMPPEQFYADSPIDPRSDIFSLGMVLYEMLRGTHAFDLEMSTRRPGEPVRIEHTGIDAGLVAVIERCLAQKLDDRYESVAELAVALLPFAPSRSRGHAEAAAALLRKAGLSVASTMPSSIPPPMSSASMLPVLAVMTPTPPPPTKRSRWPLYAGLGGVALAVAAGIGFVVANRTHASNGAPTAATAAPPSTTTTSGPGSPAIAINPVVRTTPVETPPSASASAATPPAGFGAFAGGGVAPAPARSGGPFKPGTKASAKEGAPSAEPAAKAPAPPAAGGTSEDLGF